MVVPPPPTGKLTLQWAAVPLITWLSGEEEMNRISRNRTSRASHPCIHPEPLEPRQLLSATPVFYTTEAVTLGSPGQVAFTATQNLAPGSTYSYDLNNDGGFEVQNSTSPACDVPAAYLATVGPHTISARINGLLGSHFDYQIQIPVNPAPDYYPVIDGLTWNYSGTDGGKKATWTTTYRQSMSGGTPTIQFHDEETSVRSTDSNTKDMSLSLSDGLLSVVTGDTRYVNTGITGSGSYPALMPWVRFDEPKGWSQTWSSLPAILNFYYPSVGQVTGQSTETVKLSSLGVQSVRLASGLSFSHALVTKCESWATGDFSTSTGQTARLDRHSVETMWFVKGIGMVKYTGAANGFEREDLAYLPDWARYLSLSSDGILHVNGTTSDDTITFAVKGKTLTCYRNGIPDSLPLASVRGIVITGQGGNDSIDASKLSIPVTITTGSGNDSIIGSKAADLISSGDGNDTILGGKGNDTLVGGLGADLLVGGSGTNRYEAADGVMDILDARGGRNDTGLWDTGAVQDTILGKITPG